MARGGRQPGSGRPPQLRHAYERVWCYAEYFSVREEYQRDKERQYWEQFDNLTDLRRDQAKLNSIPLHRRHERAGEADRILHDVRAELDDISDKARSLTRGRSCPRSSPRYHRLPRFYGDRHEVFDEVARRASEKFGREISATEIETNWKFMQAKLKA